MTTEDDGSTRKTTTTTEATSTTYRFTGWKLVGVSLTTIAITVVLLLALISLGQELDVIGSGKSEGHALGYMIALWMAVVGLAMTAVGVIMLFAELPKEVRKVTTIDAPAGDGPVITGLAPGAPALGGILSSVGEALKDLKGASAALFSGIALLVLSGVIAWQSIPDVPTQPSTPTVQTSTPTPTPT